MVDKFDIDVKNCVLINAEMEKVNFVWIKLLKKTENTFGRDYKSAFFV